MSKLTQLFTPRERGFNDLFEESGKTVLQGAELLERMLAEWPDSAPLVREIKSIEHEGDRITHDIVQKLNETFVTPIDREDIIALASALDDILDFTEEVADFMGLYRIEASMDQADRLATVLAQSCRQIVGALPRLRDYKDISHFVVEIHRLENDGDRIAREGIASLFERGIDPMMVIRWKDIIERLEEAVDATEKVANILQNIRMKNA